MGSWELTKFQKAFSSDTYRCKLARVYMHLRDGKHDNQEGVNQVNNEGKAGHLYIPVSVFIWWFVTDALSYHSTGPFLFISAG